MTTPATYVTGPQRVTFGRGSVRQLGVELARLGRQRALLVSTPGRGAHLELLAEVLGDRCVARHPVARRHTPVEVSERAVEVARAARADCVVAVGGGSAIGLSKAVAVRTGLDQIAVPTTYAGSEMTPVLGEVQAGEKLTRSDPEVLPETVIYDPALTFGMPTKIASMSGLNAIAHAVEAMYSPGVSHVVMVLAERGLSLLSRALPRMTQAPEDREARDDALTGAWLCAMSLAASTMGLHHQLCHLLAGRFDLPHAETHAVLLPYVMAYNAPAAGPASARIAAALGSDDAAGGLRRLARAVGAPASLEGLGMPRSGIVDATRAVLQRAYPNPVAPEEHALRRLLQDAFDGAELHHA